MAKFIMSDTYVVSCISATNNAMSIIKLYKKSFKMYYFFKRNQYYVLGDNHMILQL